MTHEINIYPKLRNACRQETALKDIRKAAKTRIANEDQYASASDRWIAGGGMDEGVKLATRDVARFAREEIPEKWHMWLDSMPGFPSLILYRILAELGGAIALAPGPQSLRHFCGIFPQDGKAVRMARGQKCTYSPVIKMLFLAPAQNGLMTQIRMHMVVPWVMILEHHKTYLAARDDPPKPPWWREATASRYTAQRIINEMWKVEHLGKPRQWLDEAVQPDLRLNFPCVLIETSS